MLLTTVLLTASLQVQAKEPLLIDCDPARFTDDNVAIAMISRTKKFRIEGVTVVAGNVWANEGFRNARATLQMLGEKKVPIHLGAQQPLVHTAEMAQKERPLEFGGAFDRKRPRSETETAVDFLISKLEQEPMTVLAIGPLTNIARMLEKKPSIVSRIKRLVIMGGNVYVPGNATKAAEFNFWFDPEAANAVLRAPVAEKILFGLDICNRAEYGKKEFDIIAAGAYPHNKLYKEFFGYEYPAFLKKPDAKGYLWDELAAAYLIDPSLVTKSELQHLEVETKFGPEYGRTRLAGSGAAKTRVMLDLDRQRAVDMYLILLK
jgi:inosine-uridine nucleoside N-ribohydrolase